MTASYLGGRNLKSVNMQIASILGYSNSVHKVTKLVSKERVCTFFGIDIENAEPINEEGTPLCVEHHGALYRHLNPFNKKCRTCDRSFTDPTKSRKCPEPVLIHNKLWTRMQVPQMLQPA